MDMELLEQEISKIEASIDEYDEVDTVVMADSIQAIEAISSKPLNRYCSYLSVIRQHILATPEKSFILLRGWGEIMKSIFWHL